MPTFLTLFNLLFVSKNKNNSFYRCNIRVSRTPLSTELESFFKYDLLLQIFKTSHNRLT